MARAIDLPERAAYRHEGAREGFELVLPAREPNGFRIEGGSTGIQEGVAWSVDYSITVDSEWRTIAARIAGRFPDGRREVAIAGDGAGNWTVDGRRAPELGGCLEVDLEGSAFTNVLPVTRMGMGVGERREAPACWVRIADLAVERLEQTYERLADDGPRERYAYAAPAFEFEALLVYGPDGLVEDYPAIGRRVA